MKGKDKDTYGIKRLQSENARNAVVQRISEDFNLTPIIAEAYFKQIPTCFQEHMSVELCSGQIAYEAISVDEPASKHIARARKITTTKAAANAIIPGMPKSSANPVSGNPVDVGVAVFPPPACSVSKAATVAVRGSCVTPGSPVTVPPTGVSVGAKTGVGLAVAVFGAGVSVTVGVRVQAWARAVILAAMATDLASIPRTD